jgi:hypothetical protein
MGLPGSKGVRRRRADCPRARVTSASCLIRSLWSGMTVGGAWWSLDHLVVDQDAVPTFVEVKRASDTPARREVVAQMLDYAANGRAAHR